MRVVRNAECQIGFDLAHHVTIVRYWTPSNLRNVRIPLIWGPVGGGESTPKALKKNFSFKNRLVERVRDWVRLIGECDPLVRKTAKKSSVAIATTNETADRLKGLKVKRVTVLSQLGMAVPNDGVGQVISNEEKICFICIGKQIYWKGFDLAIRAFANASLENAELILVGDGPERHTLQEMGGDLNIKGNIRFWDWMGQSELHERLACCDVLVHPSFHDSVHLFALKPCHWESPCFVWISAGRRFR